MKTMKFFKRDLKSMRGAPQNVRDALAPITKSEDIKTVSGGYARIAPTGQVVRTITIDQDTLLEKDDEPQ